MKLNELIAYIKERIAYVKENGNPGHAESYSVVISLESAQLLIDAIPTRAASLKQITRIPSPSYDNVKKLAEKLQIAVIRKGKRGEWRYFVGEKWYSMGRNNTEAAAFLEKLLEPVTSWNRYSFTTESVDDYRPVIFNPCYPWWCTGYGLADDLKSKTVGIVAFLPSTESILTYWPDADVVLCVEKDRIEFSDRYPKPAYFIPKL